MKIKLIFPNGQEIKYAVPTMKYWEYTDIDIMEDKMWGDIRREAKINPTLQDALERAIMIYKLTKTE